MRLKEVTVLRILGVLRCWYLSMTNYMDSRSITSLGSDPVRKRYLAMNSLLAASRAPLHKGCPKHQGHKGDPGVTPGTCGADGEKAQMILVWVRAPGVGNASHQRRLGFMRERP
jgi:hypothetical protein